jgi:hypothetical protein
MLSVEEIADQLGWKKVWQADGSCTFHVPDHRSHVMTCWEAHSQSLYHLMRIPLDEIPRLMILLGQRDVKEKPKGCRYVRLFEMEYRTDVYIPFLKKRLEVEP